MQTTRARQLQAFLAAPVPPPLRRPRSSFAAGATSAQAFPTLSSFRTLRAVRSVMAAMTTASARESPPANTPPLPAPPSALGHIMNYEEVGGLRRLARAWRMLRQVRGRVARGSILTLRLGGEVPDAEPPMSILDMASGAARSTSLEAFTNGLRLAAHDPRVAGLLLIVDPLTCGWARVLEMRRHMQYFAAAGKNITVFMEGGGAKEFFLGMGFDFYIPPLGTLTLNGFQVSATFLRGVLDKAGVNPQVERIGAFKSAGDQLARTEMSDAQREMLTSLLGEIDSTWVTSVAEACGVSEEAVRAVVERAPQRMEEYVEAGLVTGLKYLSDVKEMLLIRQQRRNPDEKEDTILKRNFNAVTLKNYRRRNQEKTLGIAGGRKRVALIRANGAITGGKSGTSPAMGATLGSDSLVALLRRARKDNSIAAVVIRCDSPGGSALASDIVYREVQRLREQKPVVASMGDVAASGGYYISMGASDVVAESLTLTGSVGVVVAKLSLGELYDKVGYAKETLSIGRYAELLTEERKFTDDEARYWREYAEIGYKSFVTKAADARGKSFEQMQEVAQGRVWTGRQALERGMVDHIGGLRKAIEVAAEKADLDKRYVTVQTIAEPRGLAKLLGIEGADEVAAPRQFGTGAPLVITEIGPLLGGPSPLVRFLTAAAASTHELGPMINGYGAVGGTFMLKVFDALFRTILGVLEWR